MSSALKDFLEEMFSAALDSKAVLNLASLKMPFFFPGHRITRNVSTRKRTSWNHLRRSPRSLGITPEGRRMHLREPSFQYSVIYTNRYLVYFK